MNWSIQFRSSFIGLLQKVFVSCLVLALLFAATSCSPHSQGAAGPENGSRENAAPQSVKSIVLENERKIWEAFKARDANAASALLADDVQVVTVDGRFDKAAFLRIIAWQGQARWFASDLLLVGCRFSVLVIHYLRKMSCRI